MKKRVAVLALILASLLIGEIIVSRVWTDLSLFWLYHRGPTVLVGADLMSAPITDLVPLQEGPLRLEFNADSSFLDTP
jgi:hypothetical protein